MHHRLVLGTVLQLNMVQGHRPVGFEKGNTNVFCDQIRRPLEQASSSKTSPSSGDSRSGKGERVSETTTTTSVNCNSKSERSEKEEGSRERRTGKTSADSTVAHGEK